jgi:hypothetical protein
MPLALFYESILANKKPLARGLDNLPGWNKEKRRHTSRRFRASQKRPAVTLAITAINIAVYAITSYENFLSL